MPKQPASIRFKVAPRLVPAVVAARRLGLVADTFLARLPELRREGFPAAVSVTDNFDLVAIDAWLDRRAGLAARETIADARDTINTRLSAFDG